MLQVRPVLHFFLFSVLLQQFKAKLQQVEFPRVERPHHTTLSPPAFGTSDWLSLSLLLSAYYICITSDKLLNLWSTDKRSASQGKANRASMTKTH